MPTLKKLNIARTFEICNEVVRTYHNEGYAYYRKGEYEHAITNYTKVIELDPGNAKVYVDRGDAYSKKCDIDLDITDSAEVSRAKNDIGRAIEDYTEAIKLNPGDVLAYFNRGHTYIKKSDIELAAVAYNKIVTIDELDEAIKRNPEDATTYFTRGYTYSKQGKVDLAIADYDNAALCPNYQTDFVAAGFADGGEYAFEKVIELLSTKIGSPSSENAADFYYLGLQALFRLDKIDANECFAEALAMGYRDQNRIERHLENISKPPDTQRYRRSRRRSIRRRRSILREIRKEKKLRKLQRDHKAVTPETRRDYRLAIDNYNQAIRCHPEETSAYSKRAYAYFQRGEYDLAIADYNKVIQLNPKDVTAYFNRSSAYQQKGYIDLRIARSGNKIDFALLDEAIRFNPKKAETYVNRGKAYFKRGRYKITTDCGDYDMAIADYNEALCLSPEDTMVYRYRAAAYHAIADNAYYELAQYDEAIEAYDKAIADYNETQRKGLGDAVILGIFRSSTSPLVKAYLCRGEIYAEKGDYDLAIADMSEAIIRDQDIKKTPENYFGSDAAARAYNNRGFYYYKKEEYDKAIEDLREAVSIYLEQLELDSMSNPDFATMYLNLGSIYYAQGDENKALESYDNIVRLCPNYKTDFIESKFAYGGQDAVEVAIKLLRSRVNNLPQNADNFYYTGVLALFTNDRLSAERAFQLASLSDYHDQAKIDQHLANLKYEK